MHSNPGGYINKLYYKVSKSSFVLLSLIYGLLVFILTFSWFSDYSDPLDMLYLVTVAVNSLVFGLVFHYNWSLIKLEV